jgi:hypothetical protein
MLFKKKTKLFAEINFSNVADKLPAKTVQRLSTFLNADVKLSANDYRFSVSRYITGFENATAEEHAAESEKSYCNYLNAPEQEVDRVRSYVVDLELFVSTFPEVPFQVWRQVYVRTR